MPFLTRTWMYASGVMFSISEMLKDKPAWIADVLQWNPRRSTWTSSASP